MASFFIHLGKNVTTISPNKSEVHFTKLQSKQMSLLSPELQQNINCAFNLPNIITDLDLAKTDRAHISDPIGKAGDSLIQCKSRIFDIKRSSTMMYANEITESQPMSTSMDFLWRSITSRRSYKHWRWCWNRKNAVMRQIGAWNFLFRTSFIYWCRHVSSTQHHSQNFTITQSTNF